MKDKHRISRVTTGTGDRGETGLADGSRMSKNSAAIEALGELDELSSALGVLVSHDPGADHSALLANVQQALFDLGAEVAFPGSTRLGEAEVTELEAAIDQINRTLPPLREFVLPGGSRAAAWCHHTRTLARRCERRLVTLHQESPLNPASLIYINRLSDALFVMARDINRRDSHPEVLWRG